jgi:hypothetical protein
MALRPTEAEGTHVLHRVPGPAGPGRHLWLDVVPQSVQHVSDTKGLTGGGVFGTGAKHPMFFPMESSQSRRRGRISVTGTQAGSLVGSVPTNSSRPSSSNASPGKHSCASPRSSHRVILITMPSARSLSPRPGPSRADHASSLMSSPRRPQMSGMMDGWLYAASTKQTGEPA